MSTHNFPVVVLWEFVFVLEVQLILLASLFYSEVAFLIWIQIYAIDMDTAFNLICNEDESEDK